MTVLVTGANGHIGNHVVRSALAAGMTPIAFVRANADKRALAGLDVEVRTGDILDVQSLEQACEGVDVVFHVAAVHRNYSTDPNVIMGPAVEGTKNAIAAAQAKGVKRLVYTSSGATIGFTADPKHALTEDDFLGTAANPYVRGKIAAERLALEAAKGGTLEVVVLNPSGVFGPRDYRLTPATRGIMGILQGDPLFFHLCPTDVRDVGTAHVLAAEKGKSGRRYIVTGPPLSPVELRDAVVKLTGIKPPTFQPPRFVARFLAGRMEKRATKEGGDANLTRAMVEDNLGKHLVYDATRIKTELGATFRSGEDVLRDAIRWLLFFGGLKPKIEDKIRRVMGGMAAPDADWTK